MTQTAAWAGPSSLQGLLITFSQEQNHSLTLVRSVWPMPELSWWLFLGCWSVINIFSHWEWVSCSRQAEDQTGTRCGYLAVTPAGTVTGYTHSALYLYRLSLYTDTLHTTIRLVTFPIIKDLLTFTERELPRTAAVNLTMAMVNCVGMLDTTGATTGWFEMKQSVI